MNPQPNPPLDAADREDWTEAFRYLALIMLVVLGGAVVVYTSAAIKPLIISGLVAYVLSTIVDGLRKVTHLSRQTLVVIVYFTSLAAFLLLPALLAPTLVSQSQEIYADLQFSFIELRTAVLQPIQTPSGALYLGDVFPGIAQLSLSSLLPSSATIIELLQATSTNLAWTVMIVVTTYYLLAGWPRLRSWIIALMPAYMQPEMNRIYVEVRKVWHTYLWGNMILMLIVGVVFSIVYTAIGLPGGLTIGILAGVLSIIPELGPATTAVIAVVVALLKGSTYLDMSHTSFGLLVLGIYTVLINIKSIWLRPYVLGRQMLLPEGVIFTVVIIAALVQGVLGALIVVPVLGSLLVVGRYIRRRLLGLTPFPTNDA
ncbi:MAG: AI-2E family transporter [Chloroflexi bacterium]|nr:MAG: AI-2E family transporter [Chloroflexota bacterium]